MEKALTTLCMICILASCLVGCTQEPIKNKIGTKELSQEQADIVNLLSNDYREILIFDYKTEEAYQNVEFWIEIYEYETLMDRLVGVKQNKDAEEPLEGQLAIIITPYSGFQWSFTISEDSMKISSTSKYTNVNYDTLGNAYGSIIETVTIEDGKEIILYTSIFSDAAIASYDDKQIYIEQPELLNEYPLSYIIKCKFDK